MKIFRCRQFILSGLIFFSMQAISGGVESSKLEKSAWLMNIFPSMKACTPTNLYYDKRKKSSVNRVLELKGYKAQKVENQLATYKINEHFFDFYATELSIPSEESSIFSVTVRATPEQLAQKITLVTGSPILIFKNKKPVSGEAYIAKKDATHSYFICFTYEE